MTDSPEPATSPAALPAPTKRPRPRLSVIWLIPLVALIIGGWLVYKTLSERGPTITITFQSASGLEPGKTKIKYLDVDVGTVTTVRLSEDLRQIIVTAEMSKDMEGHLNEATKFWVVQPRLTAAGVSGLGTLLSGSYIGMLPGARAAGVPQREFAALPEPPVLDVDKPGRRFRLKSPQLGSVSPGSGIYYRGILVGTVLSAELDEDRRGISFLIFIDQAYQDLVRAETRFWNASGVRVELGGGGVTVQTESLQSLLSGGIAFETPLDATLDRPSEEGAEFTLYADYAAVKRAGYTRTIPYLVEFDGSVRGLSVGAPVDFRGIQIGTVTDVRLVIDPKAASFKIPVVIEIEPERAEILGDFANMQPYQFMGELVRRGLRAQLVSGSLVTGQLIVALDIFPNAKPAELKLGGRYPQIPTVPSNIEILSAKAQQFLDKLAALPLPQLMDELRRTVRTTDQLLAGEGKKSLGAVEPLLLSLAKTSEEARTTLKNLDQTLKSANSLIGDDSRLRYDLLRMIQELTQTARSLRTLSQTLERQPQSILFGKEGTEAR
jgi:paraquat-inducible protein B